MFVLASFLTTLRGEEALKIVLGEAKEFYKEGQSHGNHKHVILPLRGRFKGESGESYHLVVVTVKSNSGLQIGPWIKRAMEWRERRRIERGFLFVDEKACNVERL